MDVSGAGSVEGSTPTEDDIVAASELSDVPTAKEETSVEDGAVEDSESVVGVWDDKAAEVELIASLTVESLLCPEDEAAQPETMNATALASAMGTQIRLDADMTNPPNRPGEARIYTP